jgi:hypothetical protein
MTEDRERDLIQQYQAAHGAYLEALAAARDAIFGRSESPDNSTKTQIARAKNRMTIAEQALQEYWSAQANQQGARL